jgi:hypothetical protein
MEHPAIVTSHSRDLLWKDKDAAMTGNPNVTDPDVILVGAGIMSATLGVLLKEVEPALTIAIFETLHDARRRVETRG